MKDIEMLPEKAAGQDTPVEVAKALDAPPAQPANSALNDTIEQWFRQHFCDSVVSRNTEVFNHIRAAVDTLKKELAG